MIYYSKGGEKNIFSRDELKEALFSVFDKIGKRKKVLVVPPDFTRFHSQAGLLTQLAYEYYGENLKAILPALGTHVEMNDHELGEMFGNIPKSLFQVHDWRNDLVTLGIVPGEYIKEVSEGKVDYPWPAQVNKLIALGGYDLILSIGQVVPHEVIGMANYNKNIFVGTGGKEGINKSHFMGAVYGMERMMGRKDTPVRKVLNYASKHFAKHLPIVYIQTVIERDIACKLNVCGLFVGDDEECFNRAADLSMKVNFELLENPLKKVVVYLDPKEYKSTWLGNKSIYRTRMAIADKGELIVLAPGVKEFGEDKKIDELVRKYGYSGTEKILELTKKNQDLQENLSAAAHLIHGSSEGRFSITYCPGYMSKDEIEKVNFGYADLNSMINKYNPAILKDGINIVNGEEIFYISNPALGLWAWKGKFNK